MINKPLVYALVLVAPLLSAASPLLRNPVGRFQTYGVSGTSCNDVYPEPTMPNKLPKWASASIHDLRKNNGVEEIGSEGVFRKGDDIVIKTCSTRALEDTVQYVVPYPNKGTADLSVDIYFGCAGGKKHVINMKKPMQFGTGAENTSGTFRLIASDFNVELNGGHKTRILKANRYSSVTLYGLVFRNGYMGDMEADMDDIPTGGYSGAAVLASFWSTVVVYKCEFYNNHSRSKYVRYSSGGAIMAETSSQLYVWGSYFEGNHATNGGAIACSSAELVYVVSTTFMGNVAHGGYDMSKTKTVNGKKLPVLQIIGGALRVDSVKGHKNSDDHVFVCNTKFEKNELKMSESEMKSFGYTPDDASDVSAGAAAFGLWNKQGTLELDQGDTNLLTMKGCVFHSHFEHLPWKDDSSGWYVFDARGAGHIYLADTKFTNNSMRKAVAAVDNSQDFFTEYKYDTTMKRVEFEHNGEIPTVRFPPKQHMECNVHDVGGMKNGEGDCLSLLAPTAECNANCLSAYMR